MSQTQFGKITTRERIYKYKRKFLIKVHRGRGQNFQYSYLVVILSNWVPDNWVYWFPNEGMPAWTHGPLHNTGGRKRQQKRSKIVSRTRPEISFIRNFPEPPTPGIFSKYRRYKWEAYCGTNRRRTAIQIGGVLRRFSFSKAWKPVRHSVANGVPPVLF